MTEPTPCGARVIVSLDVETYEDAFRLVDALAGAASTYKVGLQLLTAEGPRVVRDLVAMDKDVFLDLKLHEIPNSVSGAVKAAGKLAQRWSPCTPLPAAPCLMRRSRLPLLFAVEGPGAHGHHQSL